MKLNNAAQMLLDRYLLAVRRSLTGQKRDDITAEIRSSLLDTLEAGHPQAREITEKQVLQVLEKMGSPRKLAAQFSPQRSLIGPRFFHIYLFVLKIVVPAVVGALTLALVIRTLAGGTPGGVFPFVEYLATLWNGAFSAAAFVTLMFAIMERVNVGRHLQDLDEMEKFDVSDLPELAEEEKEPSIAGRVIEIVLGVVGLAFFTYIYNSGGLLPFIFNFGAGVVQSRVFMDGFMRFVPLMMVFGGLSIARSATLLVQGRRTPFTDWWQVASELGSVVLTIFMLGAFPLITAQGFLSLPALASMDLARVDAGVNLGLRIILILSIAGTLVDSFRVIFRGFKRPVV
jgi:hypothetical protein